MGEAWSLLAANMRQTYAKENRPLGKVVLSSVETVRRAGYVKTGSLRSLSARKFTTTRTFADALRASG
jgi:hypothetical protein